ncbi:MAG: hypothetical protein HY072_00295 [Deltaproteobacteria bacterium]|nr:hypothetical protein [Deltaproteobacteria bacterium]
MSHTEKQIVFLILSLLALYGFIKQCLNKIDLPEIFTFLYPLPLLFWSQNPDVRLLLPIMPWYFYYLYIGILSKRIVLPVTAAIIVTYVLFYSNITLSPWNQFDHPKAQEMFKLIKKNTTEKDILVFDKPPVLGLMSERYSFFVKIPQPENTLFQRLKEYNATYIVLSNFFPNTKAFFKEIINKNSTKFKPSFSGDEFAVYKINF